MNPNPMLNQKFSCRTHSMIKVEKMYKISETLKKKKMEMANIFLFYWRVKAAFLKGRLLVILKFSVKQCHAKNHCGLMGIGGMGGNGGLLLCF